jgi:nucleotide-binding universal stress UspA family protein
MMKTILVATAGTSQTGTALDTAIALGRLFDSHVECLRIHPDPAQMMAQAAGADMGSGMAVADMWQALQDDDVRHTKFARDVFDQTCAREKIALAERPTVSRGMSASWREETGDEIQQLVARARFNDVVVIEHPAGGGGFPPMSAGALLIGTGRPIMVAPPKSPTSLTRKIAVAWKDSAEAAKAIAAALPLLAKAEKIVMLGVNEGAGDLARVRLSLDNVISYLAWQGLAAERRIVELRDKPAADSMLAAADEAKADLLVMGGYGHSRLRELIFGGFTRRVLNGVGLPVFLFH